MMLMLESWKTEFTITLVTLFCGSFLTEEIQKRKSAYTSALRQQEKRYVSLVGNMNDGLLYIAADETVTFANEIFCRLSGFSQHEISGKNLRLLPVFDNDQNVIGKYDELKEGHSQRFETNLKKKNGETIQVKLVASPYYSEDNMRLGSMLVYTDITALKEMQEILKKREEGYRTFIDQSAVGIWRAEYHHPIPVKLPFDEQIELLLDTGIICECNDFMAKMYGYSDSSELIGRRIRDFYYIENNFDEQKTRDFMLSFIKNNYRLSNAESKEKDKLGVTRFMLNNNTGVIENGCLVRTWGVQTDITDRKKTEKELVETNHELDTFFYKASHDLKGPLASVIGIVNLARLEKPDELMEKYFSMIETSVKRLDRTLLDLIDLARTRRGNNKISRIPVRGMVDEVLSSLKHTPLYEKVNFEIKIDNDLNINADKVLMLSVFQNLIHNAINYCNHSSPWVSIKVNAVPEGIVLEVSDNGNGISEKIKDRVFEMFYRGHPDSSGSGLGLFIVRNALEKMKGTIRFTSTEGRGTTFIVSIPNVLNEA
jgi:PAS domain S-box-containing protein